jgi:predicted membrane channel-forming protein YqfA (hemolysin III family)
MATVARPLADPRGAAVLVGRCLAVFSGSRMLFFQGRELIAYFKLAIFTLFKACRVMALSCSSFYHGCPREIPDHRDFFNFLGAQS